MSMDAIGNNPVAQLLHQKFLEADRNADGSLDRTEFQSFNETLKHGIVLDKDGKPNFDYFLKMDHNSDNKITQKEALTTPVLLPASMTSGESYLDTNTVDERVLQILFRILDKDNEDSAKLQELPSHKNVNKRMTEMYQNTRNALIGQMEVSLGGKVNAVIGQGMQTNMVI